MGLKAEGQWVLSLGAGAQSFCTWSTWSNSAIRQQRATVDTPLSYVALFISLHITTAVATHIYQVSATVMFDLSGACGRRT